MKKILFVLVMLLNVSVGVMGVNSPIIDNAKKIENFQKIASDDQAAKYDFNVNYRRMGYFLDMPEDQLKDFKAFFDKFKSNMQFAYNECSEPSRSKVVKNSIRKNINEMRYILNDEQYRKYIIIFNTTLKNRGFEL